MPLKAIDYRRKPKKPTSASKIVIAPSTTAPRSKPAVASKPVQTFEEFKAAGGKVEILPGPWDRE